MVPGFATGPRHLAKESMDYRADVEAKYLPAVACQWYIFCKHCYK